MPMIMMLSVVVAGMLGDILAMSTYDKIVIWDSNCHAIRYVVLCVDGCNDEYNVSLHADSTHGPVLESQLGVCNNGKLQGSFAIRCRRRYLLSAAFVINGTWSSCVRRAGVTAVSGDRIYGNGSCAPANGDRRSVTFRQDCVAEEDDDGLGDGWRNGKMSLCVLLVAPTLLLLALCCFSYRIAHPHRDVPGFRERYKNAIHASFSLFRTRHTDIDGCGGGGEGRGGG